MCFCTPSIRTPFCPNCNQAMFLRINELKQQRDHLERENAKQGELLNKVIRQRDEYKKALQWYADRYSSANGKPTVAQKAIAKVKEQK